MAVAGLRPRCRRAAAGASAVLLALLLAGRPARAADEDNASEVAASDGDSASEVNSTSGALPLTSSNGSSTSTSTSTSSSTSSSSSSDSSSNGSTISNGSSSNSSSTSRNGSSSNSSNSSSDSSSDSSSSSSSSEGTVLPGGTAADVEVNGTSLRLPLCDLGPEWPVAIGDRLPICIFLDTSPPRKMVFRVKVEEYAELVLKGSQGKALESAKTPLYAWAAVTGTKPALPLDCSSSPDIKSRAHLASCPQVYATSSHIVHVMSLVINLRDGLVSSFAWDNSCSGCGPNSCVESKKAIDLRTGDPHSGVLGGACGAEVAGCSGGGAGCDMKVFVTWAGTDKEGRNAKSAGMRMSKFTGHTLTSLYEKANQNYKKLVG